MITLRHLEIFAKNEYDPSRHNAYVVFDIETKKYPTPPKGMDVPPEWIANGWNDYIGMGAACVGFTLVLLDVRNSEDSLKLPAGVTADMLEVVKIMAFIREMGWGLSGFNSKRFDANLLRAHGVDLSDIHHYDVMDEVAKALNLEPDRPGAMRGLGLDPIAKANNCPPKSGSGIEAPKMFQLGQIEALHKYCQDDADIEATLLIEVFVTGGIKHPKTLRYLKLVTP